MAEASQDSINVVLLDADEQFRTLMAHHITTAWPEAEIESLASLGDMDEAANPHCFVLDHMTLQQAANSADAQIWFRAAAAIASSPCIVIADPSDELLAVRYMKGGAKDFLPKRLLKHDLIVTSISECLEYYSSADPNSDESDEQEPVIEPPISRKDPEKAVAERPGSTAKQDQATTDKPDGATGETQDPASNKQDPAAEKLKEKKATKPKSKSRPDAGKSKSDALRGGPSIDGYRIINPIGKGGVASVCLAYSEKLGHDVALKVLRVSKSNAANKLYERFEQEYRLVSTIDSQSVVKTYDFGRTKKEVFIALEYFPGGDLRTRMREPLSIEESVAFLQKIATALQELHALKILHRDLKPANVMLREDNSIALIDFGMAKQLQSTENLTLPGTVHGTPHYLSPEQAKGKVVDERSDIYSLGIMFFEMLERKKPYTSKNALEVCMAHISDPVPKLASHNADHQLILDWMMAKDIEERCPNVEELLGMLKSKGVNPDI
ncbi:MAG: protein kinase [Gammaproteobacteria bacterium]|nr:protein kinase [Gammaproteobacteria bacterium]